jgi:Methyl-accepting chemotaxis protein (MCP) signalling domain
VTIRQKTIVQCACGILPLLLISTLGLWGLQNADPKNSAVVMMGGALRNQMVADMMHDAVRGDVQASLLAQTPEAQAAAQTDFEEHSKKIRESFEAILRVPIPTEIELQVKRSQALIDNYTRSAEQVIKAGRTAAPNGASAASAQMPPFMAQFHMLEEELDKLDRVMEKAMAMEQQRTVSRVAGSRTTLLVSCGLALLALLGSAFLVSRSINTALRRSIVALAEAARNVASASVEIGSSSKFVADGAARQANGLFDTQSSSEEIHAMARQNADRSRSAAELVTRSESRVQDANRSLEEMAFAITAIDDQSAKISNIIKMIDGIAFQTNILALNAAIEAARAGEAGFGFAVVANEVRNLAQRSAQAAQDTSVLIEESIAKAGQGREKLHQMATVIGAITDETAKVKTLVDEVRAGSEEQTRGIEHINQAIEKIEHATQATAAGAEESASATQTLAAQSRTLEELVAHLTSIVGASAAQ